MEPCVSCIYLTYCMEYVWKFSLWIGIFQTATQRAGILLTDNIQSRGSCSVNYYWYNIARVLALNKSYWTAMNKIFIYACPCVNKEFFHDDVFSRFFGSFPKYPKINGNDKKLSRHVLQSSFVLANKTSSKSGEDVSQIIESEWFVEKSAIKTDI